MRTLSVCLSLAALLQPLSLSLAEDKGGSIRNDQIFPPAAAAKPFIDFDGTGFIINGKRTFLSSGSIHYPRVPHELWDDRLLRLAQANFNCVETYAFWNLSEQQEGVWDFTGDKDIGSFFDKAKQHGLYGIARVGPYVCAEWDFGGYPVWMKFKPKVIVRTENPAFLELNDRWYDKIIPIVAKRQINRGGNIVMVQLENEHPKGWGLVETPYFKHLSDKAVQLGMEVPHFMSGLNHGPAPMPRDADTSKRSNPWFSTEFWAGWFNLYGPFNNKKLRDVENAQWMIMARGGAGQNFYMAHGGTNFDTWNDPSGAASYDYGAAIGQAGDLRPIYYRMKRANQLAQSFPEILANGSDVSGEYRDWVTGPRVTGARRSPSGTIVFVSSYAKEPAQAQFKDGSKLTARPNETFALLVDATIAKGVKVAESSVRVLGLARNGNTVTLVVHGKPGETGRLVLASEEALKAANPGKGFTLKGSDPRKVELEIQTPEAAAEECVLEGASQAIRVLAVSSDLGCYTWILGQLGSQFVVCGPSFVQDLQAAKGSCSLVIERPYGVASCGQVAVFGAKGEAYHLEAKANPALDAQPAPALANWQMALFKEAGEGFDDSIWEKSEEPLQMGADGDISAFAWYRSSVEVAGGGTGSLKVSGKDNISVLVNGKLAVNSSVTLRPGKNSIAVFASHTGRNKAGCKMEDLSNLDNKGITGSVTLEIKGQKQEIKGWRMRGGVRPNEAGRVWGALADTGGAPALFKATFNAKAPGELGAHPIYRADFSNLKRGTMWFNGHCLGRYPERIPVRSLYLPECWLKEGSNELIVLDEEGTNPKAMRLIVETAASRELIKVANPIDAATPIVVLQENPPKNLPAMNKNNLAFKALATASTEKKDNPAGAATDGDIDTTWSAAKADSEVWLCADLGKAQPIQTCEIVWDTPSQFFVYTLESSLDGKAWTKIGDQTTAVPSSPDSPSELSRIMLSGVQARYVRVTLPAPQGTKKMPWPAVCELRLL